VTTTFAKRFWPLFAVGLVGVLALPLTLPAYVEAQLVAAAPGVPLGLLRALTLIQPALLLALAAAIGAALAHRLGLTSHIAGVNVRGGFAREAPVAIGSGLLVGALIVLADRLAFGSGAGASTSGRSIVEELLGGVFYGGLTEEIVMRWGLLSLAARLGFRLLRRPLDTHSPGIFAIAIVVTAFAFGAAHLPAASVVTPLDRVVVARIVSLNGLAGIVYGVLFWRRSLEAAMTAHVATHVAFALARLVR